MYTTYIVLENLMRMILLLWMIQLTVMVYQVFYTDYEGYSDIQLNYDVYHECYLYYYGENAAKCDPTCLIHTEKIPLEVVIEDLSIGDYDGFYQDFGDAILRYKPISSLE